MFANKSNASKVALIHLCRRLHKWGFELIDCQIYNDHLGSMGAEHISRAEFLQKLDEAMEKDSIIGNWGDLNIEPKES